MDIRMKKCHRWLTVIIGVGLVGMVVYLSTKNATENRVKTHRHVMKKKRELSGNVYISVDKSARSLIVHSFENCDNIKTGVNKRNTDAVIDNLINGELMYCTECMEWNTIIGYRRKTVYHVTDKKKEHTIVDSVMRSEGLTIMDMYPGGCVMMVDADGVRWNVPIDGVEEALDKGMNYAR